MEPSAENADRGHGTEEAHGAAAPRPPMFDDPLDPRRGSMLTASRFGQAVGLCAYVAPIHLWQLLTGRVTDVRDSSAACLHGQRTEAEARALYSKIMSAQVEPAGFFVHPRLAFIGATPDGLVGASGLLEIKCPVARLPAQIPDTYMAQVQGQLEVTNRAWCHLVFYCKAAGELRVHHIPRSTEYWKWLETRLTDFYTCMLADLCPDHLTHPPAELPPAIDCTCPWLGHLSSGGNWTRGVRLTEQQQQRIAHNRAQALLRRSRAAGKLLDGGGDGAVGAGACGGKEDADGGDVVEAACDGSDQAWPCAAAEGRHRGAHGDMRRERQREGEGATERHGDAREQRRGGAHAVSDGERSLVMQGAHSRKNKHRGKCNSDRPRAGGMMQLRPRPRHMMLLRSRSKKRIHRGTNKHAITHATTARRRPGTG